MASPPARPNDQAPQTDPIETSTTTTSTTQDSTGFISHQSHEVKTWTGESKATSTSGTETHYNEDGSVKTKTLHREERDEDGAVKESATITRHEDGSVTKVTTDANGNVTTVKKDKDGNVISEETVDAKGNKVDPKQGSGGFWDVDLIYGDHSEPFRSMDMDTHVKMLMKMDPSLEMYADQFELNM